MKNLITVCWLSLVITCLSLNVFSAQPDMTKEARDTIWLNEYKAVIYDVYDEDGEKKSEMMTLFKDTRLVNSFGSKTVSLYNFGTSADSAKGEKYRKDINNDGIDEIITIGFTGSGNCCNIITIASLNSNYVELNQFNLREIEVFYFEDLDNDSIPELIFRDAAFINWQAPFDESPKPLLIWKWLNYSYKLANFKFSDYLLSKITDEDFQELEKLIKVRVEKEYDPEHKYYNTPPPRLWGIMLEYIYADKSEKADSIFNQYWPEEIPGKDDFYRDFQSRLEKGPYWSQLKKSYWIEFDGVKPIKK